MKQLIIFLSILLFTSCATRKVQKSTETIKEKSEILIVKVDSSKINIIDNSQELIFEPIDTILPMIINGKSYKNTRIKALKKHINTSIQNNKKETLKAIKEVKTEVVKKEIKRTSFNFWWLLLLLLIPILYFVYKKRLYLLF